MDVMFPIAYNSKYVKIIDSQLETETYLNLFQTITHHFKRIFNRLL